MKLAYFADLTHTAQGVSAPTFPLGISYVSAYVAEHLGDEVSVRLFKFPEDLAAAIEESMPDVLFLSNYSWNFRLAYAFATAAKAKSPKTVVVCGGPNFPTDISEQTAHLTRFPAIDFFVQLEGELGSAHLLRELIQCDFQVLRLKSERRLVTNCVYVTDAELICGPTERITNINDLPSPYLSGLLDPFFQLPLIPMLETTRGCPFSCTFCADGLRSKNRVTRYSQDRIDAELLYIAGMVQDIDELIITDLNFAMYPDDLRTAHSVAAIQKSKGWPKTISASAGKNKPKRVIEVAGVLKGSWTMGASIQSTDPVVLESIKRKNISSDAYSEVIEYGNSLPDAKTHSEIILGLPGDSMEKHFESLRFGVEKQVSSMRMFQAMLLMGTEMAEEASRERFGIVTKFRVVPGCIGNYQILGQTFGVAEIEEIIVGVKQLSFDEYLQCRVMNLIIESFYNNSVFEELFSLVRELGCSVFDVLLSMYQAVDELGPAMSSTIQEFKKHTQEDLFESYNDAESSVLSDEMIERYVGGELGINELLVHRALLFSDFPGMCELIFQSSRKVLGEAGALTERVDFYLEELQRFIVLRKDGIFTDTEGRQSGSFSFNFSDLDRRGFRVNPNDVSLSKVPVEYHFFHTLEQRQHIRRQSRVYSNTPIGLGRLMQRSNLKLFYRQFEAGNTESNFEQAMR